MPQNESHQARYSLAEIPQPSDRSYLQIRQSTTRLLHLIDYPVNELFDTPPFIPPIRLMCGASAHFPEGATETQSVFWGLRDRGLMGDD